MGWFLTHRRGAAWKQGWTEQTLSGLSAPPPPLMAVFGIVVLFLSVTVYSDYKWKMQRTVVILKLFLLVLPVTLILVAQSIGKYRITVFPILRAKRRLVGTEERVPWGVGVTIMMLLVMVYYQSYFHSLWLPHMWRSYY